MAITVLNLGQVAAVKIAATAPTNRQILWYDTNVTSGVNWKYYNLNTSQWETLGTGGGAGNIIDDNVVVTNKTWSSNKITAYLTSGYNTKTQLATNGQAQIHYGNITNKPVIPTKTSDLINDGQGTGKPFLMDNQTLSYAAGNLTISNGNSINLGASFEMLGNKKSDLTSPNNTNYPTVKAVADGLATKQNTLVSGTTIKTINSQNVLGAGDITFVPVFTSDYFDI